MSFITRAFRARCCARSPTRATPSPPHPAASDSRRSRRRRSPGRRADRHRQDRRLRPADAAAALDASPARTATRLAQAAARADPHAHARARRAGRSIRQDVRQAPEAHVDGDVRRRRHSARRSAQLRRGVDILVATPGRLLDHHGAGQRRFLARRDARARRSRPHARHGLHPRHQARARAAAEAAPEPAVLGDVLRRDQGARRKAARTAAR